MAWLSSRCILEHARAPCAPDSISELSARGVRHLGVHCAPHMMRAVWSPTRVIFRHEGARTFRRNGAGFGSCERASCRCLACADLAPLVTLVRGARPSRGERKESPSSTRQCCKSQETIEGFSIQFACATVVPLRFRGDRTS